MPAFYAHAKFAEETLKCLPDALQSVIRTHPEAFILGTQGPDILFNYKPFSHSDVKTKGMDLHLAKAKTFFQRAHTLCEEHGECMYAYVAGFICHFMLDNACHPNIYYLEEQGVLHGRIESEFDKYLKTKFGEKVHRNAARILSRKNGASKCASLVLEIDETAIKKAIRTMRTVNGLFSIKSHAWQKFALWLLKRLHGEKFFAMFLHIDSLAETDALNPVLTDCFEQAIPHTAALITAFFHQNPCAEVFDAFDKDYKGESIQ